MSATLDASRSTALKAEAAAGHFRAIALWLNQPLAPHQLYVQVQAERPGCLYLRVEFEHPPEFEHLSRFICHRIWQLDSPLIEGIHLVMRPIGQTHNQYDRRIRVLTPALRQHPSATSPLPPRLNRPRQSFRPRHLQQRPALKTLRAFMLSGSAVAAFILGCAVEVVLSGSTGPSLPFQRQVTAPFTVSPQEPATEALTVSHPARAEDRPRVVSAALEPVAVIPHEVITNPDPTVTLVFGGDVTLDDLPYRDLTPDQQLLAGVNAYQQADVAMVSLNNPLAIAGTSLEEDFIQRQRPDAINLLKAGGVDIVDLSSENTMTFGAQGLSETLETLDRHGIYRIGAGRHEREARRPEILDVKGQRIAYLSYNQADFAQAYGDIGGINSLVKQNLVEDIRAIRDEVDWLVVNYRWQADLAEEPADWQTNLARLAIDQGADVVIGHHPEQLQGTEIYRGRPIAYSLGDLVFRSTGDQEADETAVLKVSLSDRQMKVELLPVVVHEGQPHQAVGAKADAILQRIQAISQPFPVPMEPVMVLDIRPGVTATPEDAPTAPDGSFVTPAEQTPGTSAPGILEVAPKVTSPSEREQSAPDLDMTDLEEWGPKTGPAEEFAPIPEVESSFPPDPAPTTSVLPTSESAETLSEGQGDADEPVDAESVSEPFPDQKVHEPIEPELPEAISPHGEPLVGPLSLDTTEPEPRVVGIAAPKGLDQSSRSVAHAQLELGLPSTKVFPPAKFNAVLPNLTALADSRPTETP
ncbi:MAG: CapA family protein [Leptolyngbyaceae cyanobacterium]